MKKGAKRIVLPLQSQGKNTKGKGQLGAAPLKRDNRHFGTTGGIWWIERRKRWGRGVEKKSPTGYCGSYMDEAERFEKDGRKKGVG